MKICPICNARCFSDMNICFGCMHHFDAEEPEMFELSLPQEISLQDRGSEPFKLHSELPDGFDEEQEEECSSAVKESIKELKRAVAYREVPVVVMPAACDGFQAEYKLVISLVPHG